MKLDRVSALRRDHLGDAYYFCSEGCREVFTVEPG
jgi:YHS domain-containing protein